ncbi:nickel pincer cofactor biosynthesis protein LarB [bacterium]|nr:nickel pincer cofactor biosynthesis protein LarB [bacterium]
MTKKRIAEILQDVAAGRLMPEEALGELSDLGFESLSSAKVDHHRELRTGFPEVIFAQGKTPEQVAEIAEAMDRRDGRILATRCSFEQFEAAAAKVENLQYEESAKLFHKGMPPRDECRGRVLVLSAGTSDMPVAEEAVWTARLAGVHVETLYDVGVAGVHRLTAFSDLLKWADAMVVVAGMEGALASLVGGLVSCPVVAVPTSVGYGAAFEGLAALLGMLNSCAPGVTVVNIDNGFGAGLSAARFARALGEAAMEAGA